MVRSEDVYPSSVLRKTALRVVKKVPGFYGIPEIHIDADFYMEVMNDPRYCYETENEFVFYVNHIILMDACLATCWFDTEGKFEVKAIILENQYLYFKTENGQIQFNFEISGLQGGSRTLYVHTTLREPGLTIRVEQNHPGRRAGPYRKEEYPERLILAANTYQFAMAEILKLMGIPEYLNRNELGCMLLLGFETNHEAHGDYPPHWHMIFRWPKHCGSKAPHIYMDENGAMTYNLCSVDKLSVKNTYQPNQWCKFVDCYGRDVCAIAITDDGGLLITKPNGDVYRMAAYTDAGVSIWRNEEYVGTVKMTNDSDVGFMVVECQFDTVNTNRSNYKREIAYDPLTGRILKDIIC